MYNFSLTEWEVTEFEVIERFLTELHDKLDDVINIEMKRS